MLNTFKNFQELSKLYSGHHDIDEAALDYQLNEDPVTLAYVFCKLFPLIINQSNRYFNLTESDKASFAVEELHNAMLDFDDFHAIGLHTFFAKFLNNRLRAETQALNTHKRKGNNQSESYEAFMEVTTGYVESGYDVVNFLDLLEKSGNLTDNELKYCKIIIKEKTDKESDIAKMLGISPAGVNYIKKGLQKKLALVV